MSKTFSWVVNVHKEDETGWCICDTCINNDAALEWEDYSSKWEYDQGGQQRFRYYLELAGLPQDMGMAKLTQLFREIARPLVDSSRFTVSPDGLRTKNGGLILGDNIPDASQGQESTIDNNIPFGSKDIWLDSKTKCYIPASFFIQYKL